MFDRLGDRDVLVATKDGLLVVLAPAEQPADPFTPCSAAELHAGADNGKVAGHRTSEFLRPAPRFAGVLRVHCVVDHRWAHISSRAPETKARD
jgi:hypothetical protein